MTDHDEQRDERDWAADKRDFVADRRDEIADDRDVTADAREATADARERAADAREAELDERERRLDARAARIGLPVEHTRHPRDTADLPRVRAAELRKSAGDDRSDERMDREVANVARDQADKQRRASTPATGLAMAFAEIARYLFEAENFEEVLSRVVDTAVSTVRGCSMASITIRETADVYRTAASTDQAATAVDEVQYRVHQGPCLDATDEPVVHAPALPDPRWPKLGAGPVESGVRSVASYRLAVASEEPSVRGSLNAYATAPDAYDDEAIEIGLILAAHASVVVRAIRDREAAAELGRYLHQALESRDVISQAKGMLMERLHINPDDAFDLLRRSSQHLHMKLVEIAERLAQTGEFDDATQD